MLHNKAKFLFPACTANNLREVCCFEAWFLKFLNVVSVRKVLEFLFPACIANNLREVVTVEA